MARGVRNAGIVPAILRPASKSQPRRQDAGATKSKLDRSAAVLTTYKLAAEYAKVIGPNGKPSWA